jgi:hypothetical protein
LPKSAFETPGYVFEAADFAFEAAKFAFEAPGLALLRIYSRLCAEVRVLGAETSG